MPVLDKMGELLLKVKETVKNADVPKVGFSLFLIYNVIVGFSIASAIASFAFCGIYGFKMYLDAVKPAKADEELMKKISYLESAINIIKVGSGFKTQDQSDKPKRLF